MADSVQQTRRQSCPQHPRVQSRCQVSLCVRAAQPLLSSQGLELSQQPSLLVLMSVNGNRVGGIRWVSGDQVDSAANNCVLRRWRDSATKIAKIDLHNPIKISHSRADFDLLTRGAYPGMTEVDVSHVAAGVVAMGHDELK